MAKSLKDQCVLVGNPKSEVIALLGQPDQDYGAQLRYRVDVGRRIGREPFLVTLFVHLDGERVYGVDIVD